MVGGRRREGGTLGAWIHPGRRADPYDFAMLSDIDPMVITLAVVAVAIVGTVIGVARRGRSEPAPDRSTLPAGADAALWSITEVLPDPRNHLAMKDPTSELRLTAQQRAAAAEIAATAPAVRPADAARSAQSLAARRAALAKRSAPTDRPDAGPAEPAATDDARHLTLLPESEPAVGNEAAAPAAPAAPVGPRWGESPARAS